MAKYPCKFVCSFFLLTVAFVLLLVGTALPGWYVDIYGVSFHFDGITSNYQKYFNNYNYYNYYPNALTYSDYAAYFSTGDNTSLTSGIWGCLITALILAGLAMLLSLIMMCADCCCHITKCMTAIPKIIIILSTIAGVLAEIVCALFLIKIYAAGETRIYLTSDNYVVPSYCFYLVIVTGIFLLIASCVNCGIKQTSKVDDVDEVITVSATESSGQMQQSQQQTVVYPPVPAYPTVMPPDKAVVYPAPTPSSYPQNGVHPWKIFITHISTQTSETDLKKAAKM